jgi:DNA-binding FadR family transcriptional regulator
VPPGGKIPSERQLAESLGVNRPAVREAIRTAMAAHMQAAIRRLLGQDRRGR